MPKFIRPFTIAVLLAARSLLADPTTQPAIGPQDTVDQFIKAVTAGDAKAARELVVDPDEKVDKRIDRMHAAADAKMSVKDARVDDDLATVEMEVVRPNRPPVYEKISLSLTKDGWRLLLKPKTSLPADLQKRLDALRAAFPVHPRLKRPTTAPAAAPTTAP